MVLDSGIITYLILCAGGALAGLFSGILGIGGGTVLVPVQYNLLIYNYTINPDLALRTAIATSLAVTLPTALSSAYGHYRKGTIIYRIGIIIGICGFAGGIFGGFISSNISSAILAPLFAIIMFIMAVMMIISKPNLDIKECRNEITPYIAIGFFVGIISSMIGIGGGIILAPLLILFCRVPSRIAAGTTSLFVIGVSIGGLISYILLGGNNFEIPFFSLGYLNLTWWILLILVSIPMAQIGVLIVHKINQIYARYLFIVLLLYLSVNMIGLL